MAARKTYRSLCYVNIDSNFVIRTTWRTDVFKTSMKNMSLIVDNLEISTLASILCPEHNYIKGYPCGELITIVQQKNFISDVLNLTF